MDPKLLKHLWSSAEVRRILIQAALRFLCSAIVGLSVIALVRYWRGKPMIDGVLGAAFGLLAIALVWLVSAVRTVRAVLREHGYLRTEGS